MVSVVWRNARVPISLSLSLSPGKRLPSAFEWLTVLHVVPNTSLSGIKAVDLWTFHRSIFSANCTNCSHLPISLDGPRKSEIHIYIRWKKWKEQCALLVETWRDEKRIRGVREGLERMPRVAFGPRYRNSVIEVNGMRFLGRGSNTSASGYYEVPLNSKGVYV